MSLGADSRAAGGVCACVCGALGARGAGGARQVASYGAAVDHCASDAPRRKKQLSNVLVLYCTTCLIPLFRCTQWCRWRHNLDFAAAYGTTICAATLIGQVGQGRVSIARYWPISFHIAAYVARSCEPQNFGRRSCFFFMVTESAIINNKAPLSLAQE